MLAGLLMEASFINGLVLAKSIGEAPVAEVGVNGEPTEDK
jgi:hypothetical protein